jgi:hypothetical protein
MSGPFEQRKPAEKIWLKYCLNGRVIRESSNTNSIRTAEKLLRSRLADCQKNTPIEPSDRRRTVDELFAALLSEYRVNNMQSLIGARARWEYIDTKGIVRTGRLKEFFSGVPAANVDKTMLNRFVEKSLTQGISNATVNRDLSALRRAMSLALEAEILTRIPVFRI